MSFMLMSLMFWVMLFLLMMNELFMFMLFFLFFLWFYLSFLFSCWIGLLFTMLLFFLCFLCMTLLSHFFLRLCSFFKCSIIAFMVFHFWKTFMSSFCTFRHVSDKNVIFNHLFGLVSNFDKKLPAQNSLIRKISHKMDSINLFFKDNLIRARLIVFNFYKIKLWESFSDIILGSIKVTTNKV